MQSFEDSTTVQPPGDISPVQPPAGMSTAGFDDFVYSGPEIGFELYPDRELEDIPADMDGSIWQ